jgi:LPXTG-motif cell wall-anchored protein
MVIPVRDLWLIVLGVLVLLVTVGVWWWSRRRPRR